MRYLFISDLHLSENTPEILAKFVEFLDNLATEPILSISWRSFLGMGWRR